MAAERLPRRTADQHRHAAGDRYVPVFLVETSDRESRGEGNAFRRLADVIENGSRVPVLIHELDFVAWTALIARPSIALEIGAREGASPVAFAARVSVLIADNLIPGIISFYGLADPDPRVPEEFLRRLNDLLADALQFFGIAGDVHIQGNRFGHLALGQEMIALLDLMQDPREVVSSYESLHLPDKT